MYLHQGVGTGPSPLRNLFIGGAAADERSEPEEAKP
jgi:hypothetical protein